MSERTPGYQRPVFLFDGDCAFCSACADFIGRRVRTPAQVAPWQRTDLAALGLSPEQCDEAVQWVGTDGSVASGPAAIARLLRSSGPVWRVVGRVIGWRPMVALGWPAYRWVARNRHRMPGGTAACSLPAAGREGLKPTGEH